MRDREVFELPEFRSCTSATAEAGGFRVDREFGNRALAAVQCVMFPRVHLRRRLTRFSARRGETIWSHQPERRNGCLNEDSSGLSLTPVDALLCEARLNDLVRQPEVRNTCLNEGSSGLSLTPVDALLCEARLNDLVRQPEVRNA